MSDYQRRDDLNLVPDLIGLAATEGRAFVAFNHAVEREDGVIPRKYRELIALGTAFATQCAYCIDTQTGTPARTARAGRRSRRRRSWPPPSRPAERWRTRCGVADL